MMKRVLAILLTFVFVLSGTFAAVAAESQTQKRVVYVASQPIPKAAAAAARDWFGSNTAAQEIRATHNLTLEQVKKVKLCRAYTVEFFEAEAQELYHFPLLYENTFIGTLGVLLDPSGSGYICVPGGGDAFLESLNELPSSPSAPLIFVYTKENFFVINSKNKVKLVWASYPDQKERVERQMRDVQKMKKPSRIVPLGADTAYPDQLSQPKGPLLTVKDETNKFIYQSYDGGKTWARKTPPVHISIEKTVSPKEDSKIPYTVHNNTKNEIWSDVYFAIQKWNGQKWVKCPETDGLAFIDIALHVPAQKSAALTADWGKNKLEAGRYKLIKTLTIQDNKLKNRQFTCEAEFVLE